MLGSVPEGSGMCEGLDGRIAEYVERLCRTYPDRHVGGPGNRAATALCADVFGSFGWQVERTEFDCVDWEHGDVDLRAGDAAFEAFPGPYSLPCDVEARIVAASRVEDLETETVRGEVVLVHGGLAAENLMPKNFVFYNPDEHKRIYRALETHQPAAVLAATGRNPGAAGALYPFPLIEDADFDIPSAYMKDVEGERLLALAGSTVRLHFDSRRFPARAEQVVARKAGSGPGRVVVFGHVDSREGTPGALDNATAVAMLLALAEILREHRSGPAVELVPLNGEDYYAACGQMLWVAANRDRAHDILVGFNADAMGCRGHPTHYSTYGCPAAIERAVREAAAREGLAEGPQWPQSDHGIFIWLGRPAIALTSANLRELAECVTHTDSDVPEIVDPALVAASARFVADTIGQLGAGS